MNQITGFNAGAAFFRSIAPGSPAAVGAFLRLAAGIEAAFSRPFGCGPHAFGKLPSLWDVRCGSFNQCIPPRQFQQYGGCWQLPEPRAQWTAQMTGEHTAGIDLGDGYKLQIDERNSEMTILNEATGERTRIWGDPHVEIDGQHAYDFWGTTTFTLANGTKITINTEQFGGNPNMYVASQVLITKGDNAIVVDGISQNQLGDLSVSVSNNGELIDALARDGYTLHENVTGSGWRTENGNIATQNDLNATRIGAAYGPGSNLPSQGELAEFAFSSITSLIGAYLLFGTFGSILALTGDAGRTNGEGARTAAQFRPQLA